MMCFSPERGWNIADMKLQQQSLDTNIDHPTVIAPPQGVQHGGFLEVSQRCHVLSHFKPWRICLLNFLLLNTQALQREKFKIYFSLLSMFIYLTMYHKEFSESRRRLIKGWDQKLRQP